MTAPIPLLVFAGSSRALAELLTAAVLDGDRLHILNAGDSRAYRLRAMNRFVEKAETMKNIGLAMQILEQAAKEVGDVYVNRHRKDEPDDEPPIPTRIQVDVVDARKPNAEP